MSYVKRHLLQDETVIFQTGKHWIVFLPGLIWLGLAFFIYSKSLLVPFVALLPFAYGVWLISVALIDFYCSEYAITNQRIFMKEGLFWRSSVEMLLGSIARLELGQSILGRVLGYGQFILSGFAGSTRYTSIDKPEEFQRRLNIELSKRRESSLNANISK